MKKKRILVLVLAGILAAGCMAFLIFYNGGQEAETVKAALETVEDWYTEEGVVALGGEYQVISQVFGPVKEILVKENQRVEEGDVLFVIDSTDYEYSRALAESALSGLEAQLELNRISQVMTTSPAEYLSTVKQELSAAQASYEAAKTVYEASQVLYESGQVAKVKLESDKAAYETALSAWQSARGRYEESSRLLEEYKSKGLDSVSINSLFYESEEKKLTAQIESQKTAISQLDDRITKCRVTAAQAGIVTALPVKDMSVIQEGETAAVLGGMEETSVEADVLTSAAPYLKAGSPARITLKLRGKNESYEGTVSQIYDYAEKGTSSLGFHEYRVHVKLSLKEPEALKGKEGYGVTVEFLLYNKENVLTVPSDAVFESDGQDFVYQVQNGKAVKLPVEVEYDTGIQAVIASGLQEGDSVIQKAGEEGIYDGVAVKEKPQA